MDYDFENEIIKETEDFFKKKLENYIIENKSSEQIPSVNYKFENYERLFDDKNAKLYLFTNLGLCFEISLKDYDILSKKFFKIEFQKGYPNYIICRHILTEPAEFLSIANLQSYFFSQIKKIAIEEDLKKLFLLLAKFEILEKRLNLSFEFQSINEINLNKYESEIPVLTPYVITSSSQCKTTVKAYLTRSYDPGKTTIFPVYDLFHHKVIDLYIEKQKDSTSYITKIQENKHILDDVSYIGICLINKNLRLTLCQLFFEISNLFLVDCLIAEDNCEIIDKNLAIQKSMNFLLNIRNAHIEFKNLKNLTEECKIKFKSYKTSQKNDELFFNKKFIFPKDFLFELSNPFIIQFEQIVCANENEIFNIIKNKTKMEFLRDFDIFYLLFNEQKKISSNEEFNIVERVLFDNVNKIKPIKSLCDLKNYFTGSNDIDEFIKNNTILFNEIFSSLEFLHESKCFGLKNSIKIIYNCIINKEIKKFNLTRESIYEFLKITIKSIKHEMLFYQPGLYFFLDYSQIIQNKQDNINLFDTFIHLSYIIFFRKIANDLDANHFLQNNNENNPISIYQNYIYKNTVYYKLLIYIVNPYINNQKTNYLIQMMCIEKIKCSFFKFKKIKYQTIKHKRFMDLLKNYKFLSKFIFLPNEAFKFFLNQENNKIIFLKFQLKENYGNFVLDFLFIENLNNIFESLKLFYETTKAFKWKFYIQKSIENISENRVKFWASKVYNKLSPKNIFDLENIYAKSIAHEVDLLLRSIISGDEKLYNFDYLNFTTKNDPNI